MKRNCVDDGCWFWVKNVKFGIGGGNYKDDVDGVTAGEAI